MLRPYQQKALDEIRDSMEISDYGFNIKDRTGLRFGRLLVIKPEGKIGANVAWLCQCDCGNIKLVSAKRFGDGKTKSCGCLAKESARHLLIKLNYKHGKGKSKIYKIWCSMIQRCENKNDKAFVRYGERGIIVCDRWKNFENFYQDMGDSPSIKHSIDRIDNNGNYSPENCKWSTRDDQMRNTSRNIYIEYNGEKLCAKDWANRLGLCSGQVITWRLKKGWSIEKTVTTKTVSTKRTE